MNEYLKTCQLVPTQFCDLPGFYRKTGFPRSHPLSYYSVNFHFSFALFWTFLILAPQYIIFKIFPKLYMYTTSSYTLLEIVSGIKKVFIPSRIMHCSNSFIRLSLMFWSFYRNLNPLYSGRYWDLVYRVR